MVKLKYSKWPGHVRELENTVERAVVLSAEEEITDAEVLTDESSEQDRFFALPQTIFPSPSS